MRGATCAIFMMTLYPLDEYKRAHCSKVPFRSNKAGKVALICRRRRNIEPGFFIDVQKHAGNIVNMRRRSFPRVSPAPRRCRHRLRPATHASGRRRPRPDGRKPCLPVKEPSEHVDGMSSRASSTNGTKITLYPLRGLPSKPCCPMKAPFLYVWVTIRYRKTLDQRSGVIAEGIVRNDRFRNHIRRRSSNLMPSPRQSGAFRPTGGAATLLSCESSPSRAAGHIRPKREVVASGCGHPRRTASQKHHYCAAHRIWLS
jgi:hypothetical protein